MRTTRKRAQGRLLRALTTTLVLALLAALLLAGSALAAAKPGRPTAKAPKGTITQAKPTFKWSKAPRAAKYEVRVYKGSKLLVKKTGIAKLSWKSSRALPKNLSLTWKVRARNAAGNGAWSKSLKLKAVTAPSSATKYLVTSSSSSPVAGASVTISAQLADASGNPVSAAGKLVTWTKSGANGSFAAASSTTNASGLATVAFTTHTLAGTATTVTGTSPGLLTGTSPSITTTAGAASQIAVNAGNAQSAVAGTALSTAPSVIVKDVNDNVVAGVGVTFAVATGGGSGTGLSATTNPSGIATLGSWTLGTSAGSNTLTATSAGLSGSPLSFTATGTAGPATKYLVTSSSYSPVAGTIVTISAQLADANNNPVSTAGNVVTWTKSDAGGSIAAASPTNGSGLATVLFTTATAAGTATTVTGTAGAQTGTSASITTTPGPPAKLKVTTQPLGAASGALLGTQPVVRVEDSAGNLISGSTASITVTSASGSTIGGSQAAGLAAIAGVATFNDLTLAGTAGTPYTLTFASGGLTSAISSATTVTTGAASKLRITTQPLGAASGAPLGTQPVVRIEDSAGNLVSSSALVTVTSSAGSTLAGSQASGGKAAIAGVATFNDLTLAGTAGTPYTLTFASSGLTSAISSATTVTAGAVDATASTLTPASADITANGTSTRVLTVTAKDADGNSLSTGGAAVTITQSSGTGTIGGVSYNGNGTYIATVTSPVAAGSGVFVATLDGGEVKGGSASQTQATVTYLTPVTIGDSYGGGKVAYILQSGDPGYDANAQHGLIASTSDQSAGIPWANGAWMYIGTGTALGTGLANTDRIIALQGEPTASYAAGLARAYTDGVYTDWYLPSKDELYELYVNRVAIGGSWLKYYWSSSEYGAGAFAYDQNFSTGGQPWGYEIDPSAGVRAIRSF